MGCIGDIELCASIERSSLMMHRLKRLLVAAMIGLALGSVALSVVVVEGAVRIWQRPRPLASDAVGVTQPIGANWEAVQVKARDGVVLDAWLFTPRQPNGSAVILLHGVGDTRLGTLSQAQFLLRAGFMALTPDCRGHGASGGALISSGIREARDVHAGAALRGTARAQSRRDRAVEDPGSGTYGGGFHQAGGICAAGDRVVPQIATL